MGVKSVKKNRKRFVVTVDIPPGVSVAEMEGYIEGAVGVWKGSMDPESPIFDLDGKSVRCRVMRKPKTVK